MKWFTKLLALAFVVIGLILDSAHGKGGMGGGGRGGGFGGARGASAARGASVGGGRGGGFGGGLSRGGAFFSSSRSFGTPVAGRPGFFFYSSHGGYDVTSNSTVEDLCTNSTFTEEFPEDCDPARNGNIIALFLLCALVICMLGFGIFAVVDKKVQVWRIQKENRMRALGRGELSPMKV